MLPRKEKDILSNRLLTSKNAVPGIFSWPIGVLKKFAGIFSLSGKTRIVAPRKEPEIPFVVVPPKGLGKPCASVTAQQSDNHAERPDFPARCIVFSDTDNDVSSVRNTLRFAGILNKKGKLADNLEGTTIFHTGDLLSKKYPDLSAVAYWQLLRQDALTRGARVKLIVGNHEQEIWQKIRAGEKFGMGTKQVPWLNEFVESLDLFYVAGPVLFIHGYPTLEFLQTLLHFKEATGKDLNCFNTDHYKKAFRSVKAMRQYAYVRENRRINYLLYDVADASRYYKKQGRKVGAVLGQLKIDAVIHGHRPQRSGVQVDYEFSKWMPKVRMIGNDTIVKRRGIGATVIKMATSGALDIVFINAKTQSKKLRSKVKKEFKGPLIYPRMSLVTRHEDANIKSVAQG